MGSVSRGQ